MDFNPAVTETKKCNVCVCVCVRILYFESIQSQRARPGRRSRKRRKKKTLGRKLKNGRTEEKKGGKRHSRETTATTALYSEEEESVSRYGHVLLSCLLYAAGRKDPKCRLLEEKMNRKNSALLLVASL